MSASSTFKYAFSLQRDTEPPERSYIHVQPPQHNAHSNILLYLYFMLLPLSCKQRHAIVSEESIYSSAESAPLDAHPIALFLHRIIILLLEIIIVIVIIIAILW